MAKAPAVGHHRAAPLEITPEARERMTPFRERTFRAMYDAAMADGGAEVIARAQVIFYVSPYDEDEDRLSLACWLKATREDAEVVLGRIIDCVLGLESKWSEAERTDYRRMIAFSVNTHAPA